MEKPVTQEERVSIEARLGLTTFKVDKKPHIVPDQAVCQRCAEKWCLRLCPGRLYSHNDEGGVDLNYEGCLECGTCLVACWGHFQEWGYPKGGFGVQYRLG